ncbi:hypothetical protein LXH21_08985 [Flavobacterium algicola]|nr:hypothetical protein [Flavobacterium algicola]MCG9792599.1 hypothetical protein [Flavobacterium algicola]
MTTERSLASSDIIKTVGLLVDENYFSEKGKLIDEIISFGISQENIQILVYKNRIKSIDKGNYTICTPASVNWNAEVTDKSVKEFIETEFDLLINYYDVEKALLLLINSKSKAKFKAGFATVDKKLNDLIINVNADNYQVFVQELFRYIKLLNKI